MRRDPNFFKFGPFSHICNEDLFVIRKYFLQDFARGFREKSYHDYQKGDNKQSVHTASLSMLINAVKNLRKVKQLVVT